MRHFKVEVKSIVHSIAVVIVFCLPAGLCALDFSLRPGGFVSFPGGAGNISADGNKRYSIGGGGALGFELDFASIWPNPLGLGYTAGIEGALQFHNLQSPAEGPVQLYAIGGGLGLYYFPLSRLFTRLDLALGGYQGLGEASKGSPGMWSRFGGEAGFRFTPAFITTLNLGWREYGNSSSLFNSGLYLGLGVQITFEAGSSAAGEGAAVTLAQDEGVYPAFLSLYQQNPIGTISIRNNENAEIRDIRISFRAGNYTSSEFPCGTLSMIPRGRSAELPLYADFSPEILRFTDTGRILGEVIVRYRFLGKEKQSIGTVSLQAHNRNTFAGADPAGLAAFVSPNALEPLEFSKYASGLARAGRRTGLNPNMQLAVWLLEGLRAAGIRLNNAHTIAGEVQFPSETLGFRTGTNVDLGLLYAAELEAAGVPCAIVPLENDFIVACRLEADKAAATLLFNSLDRVLLIDDEAWLPISMNAFNQGFTAAWDRGVQTLNAAFTGGVIFISLAKAWTVYPPAPLPAQGGHGIRADETVLTRETNLALQQYIDRELTPRLRELQREAAANPTAAIYNQLGILLVRTGRVSEAKTAYERAAGMGLTAAMTNRGNLALIEKDYAAAERWFRQALARDPENITAREGLERARELGGEN
jgi:hypothetical protein